jgi:hypothetical protein
MLPTAPPVAPRRPHPLVNRDFALLWSGQVVSTLGDTLLDTTRVLWLAVGVLLVFLLLGVPNATSNIALWSLVIRATPPVLLGLVSSVLVPAYMLSSLAGIALVGSLASGGPRHLAARALGFTFGQWTRSSPPPGCSSHWAAAARSPCYAGCRAGSIICARRAGRR